MKNYLTLIFAIFWITTSQAQCFQVLTVDWELDGTYTMLLEVLDDGTMIPPGGTFTPVTNGQNLTYQSQSIPDSVSWIMVYPDNTICEFTFMPDLNTFINSFNVTFAHPSVCGGNDGLVCASLPEFGPLSYYLSGVSPSDPNGCVAGLSAGTYTLLFSPIVSGGVTYSNPNRTIELFGLQVELIDVNGTLTGSASGGTPDYQFFYNSGFDITTYSNYEAGCFHVEVVDDVGCSAESIAYYSPTIIGDLEADSDNCVNTADLLALMGDLGQSYNILEGNTATQSDFDCDGQIGVSDMLFFLTVFGNCAN